MPNNGKPTDVKKSTDITPALSKDVSFTDKVQVVDAALKNRTVAQANIKKTWGAVAAMLAKYGRPVPAVRPNSAQIHTYGTNIVVYEKAPEEEYPKDVKKLATSNVSGFLTSIRNWPNDLALLEKKFKGITDYLNVVNECRMSAVQQIPVDEKKTAKAKLEITTAIAKCVKAMEAYDETVDQVNNVREYISIVKDVAAIQGIANGK